MIVNKIILLLMAVFAVIGGFDRIQGNKWGLGEKFEEGVRTTGDLLLIMLGIMVLVPILAQWLLPILTPVYRWLGADVAMFAGTFIGCDGGGAQLAWELTEDKDVAYFSGILLGSMLGVTIMGNIPMGLKLLPKENHDLFFLAVGCGLLTIPLGCFVGGLVAGFSVKMMCVNLLPIVPLIILLLIGILKFRRATLVFFRSFAWLINTVITIGLCIAIVQSVTGIVLIENLGSIEESAIIIVKIGLLLGGAFPLAEIVIRTSRVFLDKVAKWLGIDAMAVGGMIASLANYLVMLKLVEQMGEKGKFLTLAFTVSAAYALGDFLGFTAAFAPDMVTPMLVGKLSAGAMAIVAANIYWKYVLCKETKKQKELSQHSLNF